MDNAVAETFLDPQERARQPPRLADSAPSCRSAVFEYIEAFYNRQRRHSTLNHYSPVEHEALHATE